MNTRRNEVSISVVIPAYNAERWISETLESILAQSYPASEVIVVDDGSTDATVLKVGAVGQSVKCLLRDHRGAAAARNAGILESSGAFVAFCDADDLWRSHKLEAQVDLALSRQLNWVVCDADWIDEGGLAVGVQMPPMHEGDVLESLFLANFIKAATPMVARSVFQEVGLFDEAPDARITEDWDMWLRIAARYPLGVIWDQLASVRIHESSVMATSTSAEQVASLLRVVDRAVDREPTRLRHLQARATSRIWRRAGVRAFREGQTAEAGRYFTEVLRCEPWDAEASVYLVLCRFGPKAAKLVSRLNLHLW